MGTEYGEKDSKAAWLAWRRRQNVTIALLRVGFHKMNIVISYADVRLIVVLSCKKSQYFTKIYHVIPAEFYVYTWIELPMRAVSMPPACPRDWRLPSFAALLQRWWPSLSSRRASDRLQ